MPTTPIATYTNRKLEPVIYPELARTTAVPIADGTYTRGTVMGQITTGGKFAAYDDAENDGTQVARAILQYDTTVSNGSVAIGDEPVGTNRNNAPVYIAGFFNTDDLTGLDANGLADLQGRIVINTLASNGLLHF